MDSYDLAIIGGGIGGSALATLTKLGVSGFSLDDAWEGYVRYAFSLFIMAFAASMIVERTERGDKMFLAMLRGGAEHVQDLNALSVLTN